MLEDAIYYSRREAEELAAAQQAKDLRARQIHGLLADRYGQLAKRALAGLPESGRTERSHQPAAAVHASKPAPGRGR